MTQMMNFVIFDNQRTKKERERWSKERGGGEGRERKERGEAKGSVKEKEAMAWSGKF